MTHKSTLWIVRTALMLALLVVAQFAGKLIPAGAAVLGPMSLTQLITGSLVNLVLIVTAATVGAWSGITVGVLSSVLALILGIQAQPIITPAVALGNVVIVLVVWIFFTLAEKNNQKPLGLFGILGVVVGAAAKTGFLWLAVPALLKLIPEMKPKQAETLTLMFSYPQLATALIGGLLALLIIPTVKRALGNRAVQ